MKILKILFIFIFLPTLVVGEAVYDDLEAFTYGIRNTLNIYSTSALPDSIVYQKAKEALLAELAVALSCGLVEGETEYKSIIIFAKVKTKDLPVFRKLILLVRNLDG